MLEYHEQLKSYMINYYKNVFVELEEGNFSMDESQRIFQKFSMRTTPILRHLILRMK
jgi:hypothetical protein